MTLRNEALQFYSPTWNQAFYDSIAKHVPNYVPSTGRTTFKAKVNLPKGAVKPLAVLSASGYDFQDNQADTTAYQYWGDIDTKTGLVSIPTVKAGTYRLTVYAEGIFGQYTQDNIKIVAGKITNVNVDWDEESCGTELWRIGVPDKSSGEYKHGYEKDPDHPLHPAQYRSYWPVHDFPTDFPNGVAYEVGKSDYAQDFNYVHWSVFGGYANSIRPEPYYENVNNWTILFDLEKNDFAKRKQATFTIQLAGAKTAAGNTDLFNATQPWNNLPLTVVINGKELAPWVIPCVSSLSSHPPSIANSPPRADTTTPHLAPSAPPSSATTSRTNSRSRAPTSPLGGTRLSSASRRTRRTMRAPCCREIRMCSMMLCGWRLIRGRWRRNGGVVWGNERC